MTETNPPRGTSAHMPDLNWRQGRETVLTHELSVVQIEATMKDSNASVDELTESFTTLAGVSENLAGMVHPAVIAFPFYDKPVQRLAHVGLRRGELSELVADNRRLFDPSEWVALQDEIRTNCTTREEIAMFDAVMDGMPRSKPSLSSWPI